MLEDEKKAEKKRKKFAARLKSSKGIIYSEVPSINIALCNVGQATGLQKNIVHEIVSQNLPDVPLPKFIAEKGESHSFIVFNNSCDAERFYNTCNAKVKLEAQGPPIYMIYVENVPTTDILCPHKKPKGLQILENFITPQEEAKFISIFDWTNDNESSNLKNRQVKHYGYEFRYGSNDVDLNCPLIDKIPADCDILWERLQVAGVDIDSPPDQLTVNKYLPGQGIPSHVDKHSPFGGTILSLSLGSAVVMEWRQPGKLVPVLVPARSMLVMTDAARYDWQHGIQSRTWDNILETRTISGENVQETVTVITSDTVNRETRISLTFRWTRQGPCDCKYKTLCDSVSRCTDEIGDSLASNLEDLHVHQVYEQIAGHFSTTRHKPWPKVVEFLQQVTAGDVVCDLGCGNGKNILRRNDIFQLAGERSSGLLSECKQHIHGIWTAECVRLDLLACCLRNECADYVICIAVIHHFSSKLRRLQALSTICRLLRAGGRALITVWAKDQTKSNYLCKNKLKNESVKSEETLTTIGGVNLPIHENRTQFQHSDLLVPWKLRQIKENKLSDQPDNTLLRYYHVFQENELVDLCNEINELRVETSFYEEGNWCVICTKM